MTRARISELVQRKVRATRRGSPALDTLLRNIAVEGDIALVGGAPRDWFLRRTPRDLDIVVEATAESLDGLLINLNSRRTRYGGHHIVLDGVSVDIWSLQSTWAFGAKKTIKASFENLPQTAFYNVDALAVSISTGTVYECGFVDAMEKRELSTLFEDNPYPALCAVRGFVLAQQYGLALGRGVVRYVDRLVQSGFEWGDLDAAQLSHYRRRRITPADIRKWLPPSSSAALLRKHATR